MKIIVDDRYSGRTVKEVLFADLKLSRGQVTSLKNTDGIRVNGEHVTVRYTLCHEDALELALEDRDSDVNHSIEGVYHPIDILYEDDDIICINKASGMATHPSHNHHGDTLANALVYYYETKGMPFVFRAVNRLDRETSGIVLVAKNRRASSNLSLALKRGEFVKTYYAVVKGCPEKDEGRISTYIVRREDSIIFRKASATGNDSEYAETVYKVIERYKEHTLVKVMPITGRTHQIRVHMAYLGHPIYGDGLYGAGEPEGLMLHASELEFPMLTGGIIHVTADLPDRFELFLEM